MHISALTMLAILQLHACFAASKCRRSKIACYCAMLNILDQLASAEQSPPELAGSTSCSRDRQVQVGTESQPRCASLEALHTCWCTRSVQAPALPVGLHDRGIPSAQVAFAQLILWRRSSQSLNGVEHEHRYED